MGLRERSLCEGIMNLWILDKNGNKIEITPETKLTYTTVIYGICKECGKQFSRQYRFKPLEFICTSCKRKQTNLRKYGTENPFGSELIKKKIKQTNLKRYGVDNPSKSEIIKRKREQTFLQRYGVKNNLSLKETREKIEQTNLRKYGVKSILALKEVRENGMINKYGKPYPTQVESIKKKIIENNIKKYGVDNPSKLKEIKEKIAQTTFERYGVRSFLELPEIQKKAREAFRLKYGLLDLRELFKEKYGVDNPSRIPDFLKKRVKSFLANTYDKIIKRIEKELDVRALFDKDEYVGSRLSYKWQCLKCGTIFFDSIATAKINRPRCPTCYPPFYNKSLYEDEISEWLQNLNIEVIQHKRIDNLEIDIFLPEYKLGIEFNGLYWHSEVAGGKDRNYHLNKTKFFNEKGIRIIHIFEDEWIDKREIVKSIIKNILGMNDKIYARECDVIELGKEKAELFLLDNHIIGNTPAAYKLGLVKNEEIVAVLLVGKSRYSKNYDFEIIRYATIKNITIVGGFSKLLSHLPIKGKIISYADLRYFTGRSYKKIGFTYLHNSHPNYYYTDYRYRYSRIQFQKHKLAEKLEYFDSNLTEWQNMQLNGWDRIWDCGNAVYIKEL